MWNMMFSSIVLLLGFYSASVCAVSDQILSQPLHEFLFTNYTPSLIPVCDQGGNVTLRLDIALRQIMELNEREQILSSNIWLRLTWNDCRLQWDPALYNNLTYHMVEYSDVWAPDITLYDSAADEVMFPGREDYRVYISSSGSVTYNFPTVVKSICRVAVKYFPFDTQECPLKFGSWSHHGLELDVVNKESTGDLDSYIENTEWSVTSIPVERHVFLYNCCPEPYPDVTFYIVMDRRPDFYLLTMLFPCILTSCVAALGFLLPVESGEKVSLEITVLLSLAVFLLLVSEALPPSSDNFPIIGSYFASSMVLVSLSLAQTVVVVNVFYRGTNGRKVPRLAKVILLQYVARVLCIKSNKVDTDQKSPCHNLGSYVEPKQTTESTNNDVSVLTPESIENRAYENGHILNENNRRLPSLHVNRDYTVDAIHQQSQCLERIENHMQEQQTLDNVNSEWRDISNVMDRLFLVLYLFILVVTTLSLLLQCV